MPDIELHLRADEARLIFLAIAYHLGRPGSELDPMTKQPVAHGLAEVASEMQPQLRMASATIHLNNDQLTRLLSGMLGSITELKAYPMLELRPDDEGGRRSSVPGFDRSLRHLFPAVEEDIDNAMDIAEHMLMLKRRFDERLADLPPEVPGSASKERSRRWWPFRR